MSKTAEDHRREAGGELREKEDRREGSLPRDYIAQAYFGHWGGPETHRRARRRIDWMASQAEGERVLDVGCSEGILAILLAREGITVTAVDVNPDAIAYAKDLLQQEGSFVRDRVTFLKTDLYAAGLAHGAFDTVMLGEVIEHLDQPALMIDRVAGLLKETGRLVLTTPFGYFPHEDHRQTFGLSDVVRLVERHFSLAHIDVTDGYVRVVARKRLRGDGLSRQIDLGTLLPLVESAAIAAQRELHTKLRDASSGLSGIRTKLHSTAKALTQAKRRLEQTQRRLAKTSDKLRETNQTLRRDRRWLRKVRDVAGRRKCGPVYRLRRALATATWLPGLVRRFLVRRLIPRRLRRTTDIRVRQPRDARSASHRAGPPSAPGSRSVAIDVPPAASTAEQTQPPADETNSPSADLTFRAFFGLRLAFADRVLKKIDSLDGKRYIFIGNPRKLFDAPDPRSCLLDHYGINSVADSVVGMTSSYGGWYRAVARLKSLGVTSFVIMLDPARNERLVAKRMAIRINAIKTIFIPNYKCGFASFRRFCFDNFDEFNGYDRDNSSSLNQFIDFSNSDENRYFVFSIIRNPISRFKSLYFDKFCKPDNHINVKSFLAPFCSLLGKSNLTPNDVLDVIVEIPDEYSDAHWKSQYHNTTHHGRTLVDFYVRMEQIEEDLNALSGQVGFKFDLARSLSTAEIARSHRHNSHFEGTTIRERLLRRYPNDFSCLEYS
jgi:SAM-dependent methyltransferase